MVVFITGKAGAGKTTVARKLKKRLEAQGEKTLFFDADEVRDQRQDFDFSGKGRYAHIKTMADFAAIAERQGFIVIIAAVMPETMMRWNGRKRVKESFLVYVMGGTMWPNTMYFPPSEEEKEGLYYEIQPYDR